MTELEDLLDAPESIVLFDGDCGFCGAWIRFVFARDRRGRIRFCPLQSELGQRLLEHFDLPRDELESIVLVEDRRAFTRSTAVLRIAARLDGCWSFARWLRLVPRPVRDWIYDLVARNRHRISRRLVACPIPPPEFTRRVLG